MTESPTAESPAVTPERLIVQAVMKTDVGLVRSENQDFGTYTTPAEERESHPGGRLFVVADGMGGHRGGATASRIAGETVKAQYLGSEEDDIAAALRAALARANARIFTEAQANPDLRGMGTTTSALVVSNNNAWFAHVGDSRIYMIRDGAIKQLTEDHSLVASMVREGLLTSTEAENHPRRNVLQRSMGVGEDVEIDVSGPFPVQEGDVFILCSDGLHGLVKEAELLEIATSLPLEATANEYVRRALDRGAPDNVTVIVARIIRPDELTDDTVIDRSRDTTKKVAVTAEESPLDETQPLETLPELDQTVRVNPPPPPPRRKGLFRWLFGDSTSR
jgi:PPM family protein phosphatase